MERKYKFFSGIVAGFTAALVAVSAVGSFAADSPFGDFSKSYKTSVRGRLVDYINRISDNLYNFNDSVNSTIFGDSGSSAVNPGSYSQTKGYSGLQSNAVNDVVNSSGFASDVDSLLVAYAKASTGAGGEPVVTEITVPTQLDFSGQVFCTGSGGYEELFQFHLVYNGYRYTQGFFPDCAIYFSRVDQNLVEQTYTLFLDPTYEPVFEANGFTLDFRCYRNNSWSVSNMQLAVATVNSIEYIAPSGYPFSRPGSDWWDTYKAGTPGSRFSHNPKYFLTDAYTNNTTVYNFINQKKEGGGSGFTLPVGFAPVAAGVVISADSLVDLGGFSFDSVLGGLTFNMENAFDEFVDKSANSLVENYEDFYSSIAEHNALWASQERQNYYDLYNYVEPLPPVTGGGGVPEEWLQGYPTVTTAWSVEPYGGTYPDVTLPTLASPVVTGVTDLFDISGLAPLALTLVTVGIVLSLL